VRLHFRYRREKTGSSVTLYFSVQLVINWLDLLQFIAQIYYKSSMTVHKCTKMYESVLHYKYSTPATRFGHSCGRTRGGALQRMDISRYYKIFEIMYRCKILYFNRTWSKLDIKVAKIRGRQVYKILLHIYVHLLVSLPLYFIGIYQYRTIKLIPTYFEWYTYMQRSYLLMNFMPFDVLPHDSYVHQSKHFVITYIFILIYTSAISWME
jgi:hypothetical protein